MEDSWFRVESLGLLMVMVRVFGYVMPFAPEELTLNSILFSMVDGR
jgi:hypothetical protein